MGTVGNALQSLVVRREYALWEVQRLEADVRVMELKVMDARAKLADLDGELSVLRAERGEGK